MGASAEKSQEKDHFQEKDPIKRIEKLEKDVARLTKLLKKHGISDEIKIETYQGSAPYSYDTHERIDDDKLTPDQKKKVVAWEACNSFSRCKCGVQCVRGVIRKEDV